MVRLLHIALLHLPFSYIIPRILLQSHQALSLMLRLLKMLEEVSGGVLLSPLRRNPILSEPAMQEAAHSWSR